MKRLLMVFAAVLVLTFASGAFTSVLAAETDETTVSSEEDATKTKALAAAAVVGVVAAAGAIGMAIAIGKSTTGMSRQPEAADKINSAMMLGLVFIETAIIYALIVAILIIFVL